MRVAIVGCGNMGASLASRLHATSELFLYDHSLEKAESLAQKGYGVACKEMKDALHPAEVILLVVKPQNMKEAAVIIDAQLQKHQMIISLLAGTPLTVLRRFFSAERMARMMPNLPLVYGEGVIGLSADEKMTPNDKDLLTHVFEPLGEAYWISEEKMDALTALTGSGPAFFFAMVEAMIEAGVAMGFSAKESQDLVYMMLKGSVTLLKKTDKPPREFIQQIASPQGTTIAGLNKFEELGLSQSIVSGFLASYKRATEFSTAWEEDI